MVKANVRIKTNKGSFKWIVSIVDKSCKFSGNPVLKSSGYCEKGRIYINMKIEATDAMICEGLYKINGDLSLSSAVFKNLFFITIRVIGVLIKIIELRIRKK